MNLFLICFVAGASILLSFLLFFHPLQQNVTANRWLGFFVFIMGCAFTSTYLIITESALSNSFLFKSLNSLQFLLAPSLYISILYFVHPTKVFRPIDWLHFIPFVVYVLAESTWNHGEESISKSSILNINSEVSFLVRDILPFLTLFYIIKSYLALAKHSTKLKLISSTINKVNLGWLVQFLFILLLTVMIWINDALFELPLVTEATPFVYTASVFFLAYFSIRQRSIFAFKEKDIRDISDVLNYEDHEPVESESGTFADVANDSGVIKSDTEGPAVGIVKPKPKRLSAGEIAKLSVQLNSLMEHDRLFLDNDLNLATVAEKLGVSIHEASFLINETTNDNFYTFINKYRVAEAKKLLSSSKMKELNILGIAFASGFNSKTTFNTTFKKIVGISPSQYSKEQKKQHK